MEPRVHENYIKASNLMFWALGLGFVGMLINAVVADNGMVLFIGILAMIFNLVFALLTRQGYSWMKIVLSVIYGLGLLAMPFLLMAEFNNNPLVGFISLTVTVLHIAAVVKLFQVPYNWVPEEGEEEAGGEEMDEGSNPQAYIKPDLEMPDDYGKLGS